MQAMLEGEMNFYKPGGFQAGVGYKDPDHRPDIVCAQTNTLLSIQSSVGRVGSKFSDFYFRDYTAPYLKDAQVGLLAITTYTIHHPKELMQELLKRGRKDSKGLDPEKAEAFDHMLVTFGYMKDANMELLDLHPGLRKHRFEPPETVEDFLLRMDEMRQVVEDISKKRSDISEHIFRDPAAARTVAFFHSATLIPMVIPESLLTSEKSNLERLLEGIDLSLN